MIRGIEEPPVQAMIGGKTPLYLAVENGYPEIIKILVNETRFKNPPGSTDATPLHLAARLGDIDTVQLISGQVDDANPVDIFGITPLHWACFEGHLEIVRVICPFIEDKNPHCEKLCTPFRIAKSRNFNDIVEYFTQEWEIDGNDFQCDCSELDPSQAKKGKLVD